MKPIWQIDAHDVFGLQGRDTDLAQFVNDLLAHQASIGGVANALQLNFKTQVPDGGVDAAVAQAIAANFDPDRFLDVPTCWQFKASPTRNIKPFKGKTGGQEAALREEIRKPEAARLVANGYGYRFCIADDLPPPRKSQWEAWLLDEAQKITASPSPPKVVTASDLARWANRLPGVILTFRPFLGRLKSLRTWAGEITYYTPRFVPIAAWQAGMQLIRDHVNLTLPCSRVVQTVQGEAGVGKTRCVYEALVAQEENQARVVYTTNEMEAEKIADFLANDDRFCGIIVADDCSLDSRVRLERNLRAHSARMRVIAIDNRLQDEPTGAGEIRLERMSRDEVEQILESSFPALPAERLRAFVHLSGCFVRLAIDLCEHSPQIPPEGYLGPVLNFFRDHYLRERLRDEEERKVIEAVALLPRVGCKGDVRQQLEWLCQTVGSKADQVDQTATRLKQAPGFIARGERYLYVTPQVIAQAAFQCAWARWIRPDPERFFVAQLRSDLVDLFADQLRACGTAEMREVFSGYFQKWVSRLTASDLADEATVKRLVRLVEVEPGTFLPQFRRLIESASIEELRQLHAGYSNRSARRELVWLAEKLLRLTEHFANAERILLRLALAETEEYANNASAVWKEIFRPLLSGTPMPFADRIRLLEQRFQIADKAQRALCLGALVGPLTANYSVHGRLLGSPIVAGRIPQPDWEPRNGKEWRQCWTLTVELLKRLARSNDLALRDGIVDLTIHHLAGLLRNGFLADVIEIIGTESLPDTRFAALLHQVDQFLELYCAADTRRVPAETEAAVREWRANLDPESLHGKLVAAVGQEPWHHPRERNGQGEEPFTALASSLLSDPAVLDRELPWLCSREANSASHLGLALGRLDAGGRQLERILGAAAPSRYPGIARGYILALAQNHPQQIDRIDALLDRLQRTHPATVFDLVSIGIDALRPLERQLAMVDAGQVPVEFLRGISWSMGNRPLTAEELRQVLDRLTRAARQGNEAAARAAIDVLWMEFRREGRPAPFNLRSEPWLKALVETVLDVTLPLAGREAHAWADLLGALGEVDPAASVRLAVRALPGDRWELSEEAQAHLAKVAPGNPEMVMRLFGEALLDPATGWRLEAHRLHELVKAIPTEILVRWLDGHGLPAAIALARYVPPPFIDDSGNAIVPELTAYVLERFADDEVFREFCAGVHSGQLYEGDIAAEHEQEGQVARRFLDHPLQRVRDWAHYEIERAAHEAAWWRARDEEMATP